MLCGMLQHYSSSAAVTKGRGHAGAPSTISALRLSSRLRVNWLSMGAWCVSMPR